MSRPKKRRTLKVALLSTLFAVPLLGGAGSCIKDTAIQIAGVTFLDIFVSPLVGDDCTLLVRDGCEDGQLF